MLDSYIKYFNKFSNKKLFIWLWFFIIIITLTISKLMEYIDIDFGVESMDIEKEGMVKMIGYGVIIGPVIETFIFTFLPYKLLSRIIKNDTLIIIIASLLFGISHFYSLMYIIYGVILGLILNTYYVYLLKKNNNTLTAFGLVTLLHASTNLTSLFLEYFFS